MRIKIEIETSECKTNIILDSADIEKIDDTSSIKIEKIKNDDEVYTEPGIIENKNIKCQHCGKYFTSAGYNLHKNIPSVSRAISANRAKEYMHRRKKSKKYSEIKTKRNYQCAYCGDWFGTGFISHQNKCKEIHKGIPFKNDVKHGEKPLVSVFEGSVDRKVSVADNAAVLRGD